MVVALLVFLSGAAIECACVFWVHFSERGRDIPTALCSMVIGTAQVFGMTESVHDWHRGPWFVLGYGIGTASAVWGKSRSAAENARGLWISREPLNVPIVSLVSFWENGRTMFTLDTKWVLARLGIQADSEAVELVTLFLMRLNDAPDKKRFLKAAIRAALGSSADVIKRA